MATFLTDTFTDTNDVLLESHTGETGATWTKHPLYAGTFTIDTNRVRGINNTGYYASGTPATAEYDVTAVMRRFDAGSNIGIFFRLSTVADTGYLVWINDAGWEYYKTVAASYTLITSGSFSWANSTNYTLLIECRDANKKFYIDSAIQFTDTDNAITSAGKVGLRAHVPSLTGHGLHMDSITAADAAAGGGFIATPGLIGHQAMRRASHY